MTDRVRAEDVVDELRRAFAESLRESVAGLPSAQALQLADRLCAIWIELLSGLLVAMPSRSRFDVQQITADWRAGLLIEQIVSKHGCSRKTAYRYHPQKVSRVA